MCIDYRELDKLTTKNLLRIDDLFDELQVQGGPRDSFKISFGTAKEGEYEASEEENTLPEMLCGLDQQMKNKEDGGANKMYYDLRDMYWWPGVKKDIFTYDTHLPLDEFFFNNSYHSSIRCSPFEALYERKCRLPFLWAEVRKTRLIGPKMVLETTYKLVLIMERLKAARDLQKSYADNRRKLLEFKKGDHVLLKCRLRRAR
nr:putative reverse transcriptase domain-containing protein [Tanacetum cinerariifolium]